MAGVFHVRVLHRSRRQISIGIARRIALSIRCREPAGSCSPRKRIILFVGESGVARIMQRTCEVMRDHKVTDPAQVRALGVIDLETIQRFREFSLQRDAGFVWLGSLVERGDFYTTGLKGRFGETKLADDHKLADRPLSGHEMRRRQIVTRRRPP